MELRYSDTDEYELLICPKCNKYMTKEHSVPTGYDNKKDRYQHEWCDNIV